MDTALDAAVAVDEVPEEETELAALAVDLTAADFTSASLADSFVTLLSILAASVEASILISRLAAAASFCRSRSVCYSSSSSSAAAAVAVFSSSAKDPANMKQCEM